MLTTGGRKVVQPAGSALTTFVSTAMIVAGVGLAVDGLLLAAAGVVLAVIDWNRFNAANPWAFPKPKDDPEGAAASMSGEVMRISLANTVMLLVLGAVALAAVQLGEQRLYALAPAVLAALVSVWQSNRLTAALERRG